MAPLQLRSAPIRSKVAAILDTWCRRRLAAAPWQNLETTLGIGEPLLSTARPRAAARDAALPGAHLRGFASATRVAGLALAIAVGFAVPAADAQDAGAGAGAARPGDDARSQSAAARQAAAALMRGDTQAAITYYTELLDDPSLPKDRRAFAYNDRAVANSRLGRTRQAFDDFNRAVQLFPENAAVYNNRGNLLLALGHTAEAVKDFDRALTLAPGYAAAYNNRAGAALSRGDFQTAIRDYSRAVKLMPDSAAALSGRGTANLELGRPHAAIRDLSRAVSTDESFAAGYHRRAEAKMALGQYGDAIEDLTRAIAFDLQNADLYLLRGRAYLASENAASAVTDFTRAIELRPQDPHAFAERGLAQAQGGNTDAGLSDLARAIEIDPRFATAFAYRAYVYKEADQSDVGAKDIATAWKIDPDAAAVLWAKAELAETMGQREEALADVRRALAADASMKRARDLLERLDGSGSVADEAPVPGLDFDVWRVVMRANRYVAVSRAFPKVAVPLELQGEGEPRLLAFDERPAPHKGIGVLTYSGGRVATDGGPVETEMAAIVNLYTGALLAIVPHREGDRFATWEWAEDSVTVAAVDGVTDQLPLRGPRIARQSGGRRYSGSSGPEDWTMQEQWGSQLSGGQRREARSQQRRKPKTLFELLFN